MAIFTKALVENNILFRQQVRKLRNKVSIERRSCTFLQYEYIVRTMITSMKEKLFFLSLSNKKSHCVDVNLN